MTAPTTEPATPPAEPTEPAAPATGDGLGDAGKRALTELRQQIKELERQNKDLQARDPVKAIAEALGVKPADAKADDLAATVTQLQQQMRDAELRAVRLEVAAAKGLTPAQAARLQGATREELDADADQLKELFPTTPATPGTPAPDPSQGARGGSNALEAQLKAAQDKGDARESIRIKQLLAEQRKPK
jgi:hypothetical protein